ncbi:hypothetical protein M0R88_09555 [Halorussus gelatinilyticus]|uniref:Uncharacterized protein n=1 Tax=Halorussus gelatinilyticus TaxID=2937524 RepID=A0A8U0ID06_9EURY|nr:hypothetical protein [Halorussus gelatinilyticus]UPV98777.1 hypothetical protein M0R88_09555 [Halorussus gelatinilyticus]
MGLKLHFHDSTGKKGHVEVSDGEYNSGYDGKSDAIQRLLQDAKELTVKRKNGTVVTPMDNDSEIPDEVLANVVLTWEDREATVHEKFTHVLQRIDNLSEVETSKVTTDTE